MKAWGKIQITSIGDELSYRPRILNEPTEEEFGNGTIVGKHSPFCNGPIYLYFSVIGWNLLLCKVCYLRVMIPTYIKTNEQLIAHFKNLEESWRLL